MDIATIIVIYMVLLINPWTQQLIGKFININKNSNNN